MTLDEYRDNLLALQNYTLFEIDRLLSSLGAEMHLHHDHELLKLWKSPEKVLKSLQ